jgi:hypothetical protein
MITDPIEMLRRVEWQCQEHGPAVCGNCGGYYVGMREPARGHRAGCELAVMIGRMPPLPKTPDKVPCDTCREMVKRGVVGHEECVDSIYPEEDYSDMQGVSE